MPSTRQGNISSVAKRPARRSASVKINYSDDSPKKVSKVGPSLDIKRNLGDAWSSMVKGCKVELGKNKNPNNSTSFVIGKQKLTTVKMINPEVVTLEEDDQNLKRMTTPTPTPSILPKGLLITKLSDTGAKVTNRATIQLKDKVAVTLPKQGSTIQKQIAQLAPKPLVVQNTVSIKKVASLPGISIQKAKITPVKTVQRPEVVGNDKSCLDAKNKTADSPKRLDKENIELRTKLRNVTTPIQKNRLENPMLTRSSGRIMKKPSIINSQKKAIVKTIKKLNQDQKKRIEGRLGDIGSNLQKIKPKEVQEPEPVIEKRPLVEVLSDASWLEMFLQTEPTARYNAADDTLYCYTCKDMLEDGSDDGWVDGHPKGLEWLKYREHKLREEHQKTSTKYFLQLYTAHFK